MARIQKKKPTVKKKKIKEESSEAQSVSVQSVSDDEKSQALDVKEPSTDADKEKKKKTLSSIQASAAEQTAVMKLIDRYFGSWIQFFREVKVELGKVTWPSRKQTVGSTAVVIIFVFIIALFLGAVDFGLSNIIRLIL